MRYIHWIRTTGPICMIILAFLTFPYFFLNFLLRQSHPDLNGRKVILFWTRWFGGTFPQIGENPHGCLNQKCYLTDDRYYLPEASAIVFHARDLLDHDLPKTRLNNQLYVFYIMESPVHTGTNVSSSKWRNFFNLTWTYRLDSDVPDLGYILNWKVDKWDKNNATKEFLRNKNGRAMALVSNCITDGNREEYVKELGKYFPVDVYGRCGKVMCPRRNPDCERMVVGKYSFYLSFENSHCKDYVTEKVIRGYKYGTVPVVYGGGNYPGLFPPNSYIDVDDFASPKDLGSYLHALTLSREKHEGLYEWRYDERNGNLKPCTDASCGICRLCELVNDGNFTMSSRVADLHQWWTVEGNCTSFNKTTTTYRVYSSYPVY